MFAVSVTALSLALLSPQITTRPSTVVVTNQRFSLVVPADWDCYDLASYSVKDDDSQFSSRHYVNRYADMLAKQGARLEFVAFDPEQPKGATRTSFTITSQPTTKTLAQILEHERSTLAAIKAEMEERRKENAGRASNFSMVMPPPEYTEMKELVEFSTLANSYAYTACYWMGDSANIFTVQRERLYTLTLGWHHKINREKMLDIAKQVMNTFRLAELQAAPLPRQKKNGPG